jgi:hypothetical protein
VPEAVRYPRQRTHSYWCTLKSNPMAEEIQIARVRIFRTVHHPRLPRPCYTPRPNRSGGKNSRVARQCIPAGDEMLCAATPNQALNHTWLGYATETIR